MNLVQDDDLSRKPERTDERMLHVQHGKQRLVDRPHGERKEQAALGRVEPRRRARARRPVRAFGSGLEFLQPRLSVRELHRRTSDRNRLQECLDTIVDTVAREARREGEVEPGMESGLDEPVGGVERGFRLAHSHRRLKDIDARRGDFLEECGLRRIGIEAENVPEGQTAPERRSHESALDECVRRALASLNGRKRGFVRREERFVGRDPVRNAGDARKKVDWNGRLQGRLRSDAELRRERVDERGALVLPRTILREIESIRRETVVGRNGTNDRMVRRQPEKAKKRLCTNRGMIRHISAVDESFREGRCLLAKKLDEILALESRRHLPDVVQRNEERRLGRQKTANR